MSITLAEVINPNQLLIPKGVILLTHTLEQEQKKETAKKPIIKALVYPCFGGVPRLVWQRLYSGQEPEARPGIAFDDQGSLYRGRIEPSTNALFIQKVVNPGPGQDFSRWQGAVGTNGSFALAACGGEISYFYVHPSGGSVRRYYSTNHGSTWIDQWLGNWNARHVAADYKPDGTRGVAHSYMFSGCYIGFNGSYDMRQSFQEVLGLAVKYDGDWNIIFAAKLSPHYRIYRLIRGDGYRVPKDTWGNYEVLMSIPEGQGYILQHPFLDVLPGGGRPSFLFSFVEKYTGTEAVSRPYLAFGLKNKDFLETQWREPIPFNFTTEHGLALSHYGNYAWAATPQGVWRAQVLIQATELSKDIMRLEEEITPKSGNLTIELDNSNGKYNTPPARGSEVRLNLGYYTRVIASEVWQPDTVETNHYWIESYEHRTSPNQRTLVLNCISPWELLKRWTPRHTLRWQNTTIYKLLEQVLAKVGIPLEVFSCSTISLGFMPDFTISPGDNGLGTVLRLLSFLPDVLIFSQGNGYLVNLADIPMPAYHYGKGTHPIIEGNYSVNAPEINSVQVIGRSDTTDIVVSGFLWDEINLVAERLNFEPDRNVTTLTQAKDRANAILTKQRQHKGQIIIPPNFAQKLYDVVAVSDLILSEAKYRVMGVTLNYNSQQNQLQSTLKLCGA